ncbi:hypothetical protein [Polyangium mundeleinium]|uniref:Uncharacterized protein n=1 Tax=Polyangium mundeleinium TaxID=2995306 RepID=A0ABT5EGZ7_9BACT|nr:hypothetical protein [Polyangium mundeleinium]MDC0740463.1 hypothetical protein [Polyangium mundeleinium]
MGPGSSPASPTRPPAHPPCGGAGGGPAAFVSVGDGDAKVAGGGVHKGGCASCTTASSRDGLETSFGAVATAVVMVLRRASTRSKRGAT